MDPSPSPSRRRRSWSRGFHQRSPLVLLAAIALAAVALLGVEHAVLHGVLTTVPQGRLLRINNDDYVHVAYRVAQLKKHPPQPPVVYLFGGSGAMESIVGEGSLAAALSRDTGRNVSVVSLAAHQQSFAQNLVIVDNLPPGPGVVVIGLAPMRFTVSPRADEGLLAGRPMLLRSPRLERLSGVLFGKEATLTGVLPGIFDYAGAYLRARGKGGAFWGVRIPYARHYYPPGAEGALPLAKRQNVADVIARDKALYARYADYDFVVLQELIRLAQERGYTVALYDQPLNASAAGPDWGGLAPRYRRRVAALARSTGSVYLPVARRVHLKDADFADLYHLLAPARLLWQPELARELAPLVRRAVGPPSGAPSVAPSATAGATPSATASP